MNASKILLSLLLAGLLTFCTAFRNEEVTWVAIGDSITYLNDHTNETGNRVTKGYLTNVTDRLPAVKYINKGYNGWTSGNIAQYIDTIRLPRADIYSIFLGTNDWWQARPVGTLQDYLANTGNNTVYGSFRIIIKKIRSLNPKAKIVLITPLQRADFVYINDPDHNAYGSYKDRNGQSLEAFANAVDSIALTEHFALIDLYHDPKFGFKDIIRFKRLKNPVSGTYQDYQFPESSTIPYNPLKDEYPYPKEAIGLTYDGLHPSDLGNRLIAERIVGVFRSFMNPAVTDKTGQTDSLQLRWQKYIDLDAYLKPFWKTDTITDETVQVLKDGSGVSGTLLFDAKKILSVKSYSAQKQFIKDKDWSLENGKLVFRDGSSLPYLEKKTLSADQKDQQHGIAGKAVGTYVLFSEGAYFSSKQLSVTYIKATAARWRGPVPSYDAAALPQTLSKLHQGLPLNIVFYGNSIEAGNNASGFEGFAPYMPSWADLVIYALKKKYGSAIRSSNESVSGKLAKWGLDSAAEKINPRHPDLVIIGFGMNDGTFNVPPETYRAEIKGIIDTVRSANKSAEFILIAPMTANPESSFAGLQPRYKNELDKLKGKVIVVADLTGVHQELLKVKSYQDMTGNNINHPNDYLARWYAQFICGLLIR